MLRKARENTKEDGQAIFEFVVFLPILLFLFTVIFTIGNSINGSINQQKAVRRYFFYIYKGNSTIPSARDLNFLLEQGLKKVGAVSVGWREKSEGGGGGEGGASSSFATCYPFSKIFSDSEDDDCFEPSVDDGKSNFIRIFTQFGICGESYNVFNGNTFILDHFGRGRSDSCTIQ